MLIERIGTCAIVEVRQTNLVAVVDRDAGDVEYFTSERDARQYAMERVDLVDGLAAIH